MFPSLPRALGGPWLISQSNTSYFISAEIRFFLGAIAYTIISMFLKKYKKGEKEI